MNWGKKLVLSLIVFILFISALVAYMIKVHGDDALVEENYYEKGLTYDQEYQNKQNMLDDDAKPLITLTENQIIVQLKDSAHYQLVLLRPSNKKADVKFEGHTVSSSNLILIERSKLVKGLWFFNLEWKSNNKTYQYKQNITL